MCPKSQKRKEKKKEKVASYRDFFLVNKNSRT
jgi:hypothetical protein